MRNKLGWSARKRVVVAIAITAAFLILFFALLITYSFPDRTPPLFMLLVSYHFEFMLVVVGAAAAAGASIFLLMQEEVAQREKESQLNAELALSLLKPEERKAVSLLISNGGECLQAEVARLEGMTRLKAHRTAASLSQRGAVTLERRGKVVVMKLADNVRQALVQ
ncbi:MAG: hypothetical protein AABW54_01235 [Candidatus Micrarchaeota archaeon]